MGDQSSKPEKVQNNRYWEYYLVRYLLGTVIGVVCVLYIGNSLEMDDKKFNFFKLVSNEILSQSQRSVAEDKTGNSFLKNNPIVLLLIGLVYTYIASAPILVLHSVRLRKRERSEINGSISVLDCFFVSLAASQLFLYFYGYYKYSASPNVDFLEFLSVFLLLFLVLWQTYLLYFRFKEDLDFKKRTEKLSQIRSGSTWEVRYISDYVESYRHLREHSNAFFITLFTLFLTFIVCNQSLFPTELIIFIWIVPGSAVWFVATLLELRLID